MGLLNSFEICPNKKRSVLVVKLFQTKLPARNSQKSVRLRPKRKNSSDGILSALWIAKSKLNELKLIPIKPNPTRQMKLTFYEPSKFAIRGLRPANSWRVKRVFQTVRANLMD